MHGIDESRRLHLALAVRPIFASRSLARHLAALLGDGRVRGGVQARARNLLDPEEALFLGLVRDIGRLALQSIPQSVATAFARLSQGGCPVTYTEQLLFHAALGAGILTLFHVPELIRKAIDFHYRPAAWDSVLASAVYLGEYISESAEDLPSAVHLDAALAKTRRSLPTSN